MTEEEAQRLYEATMDMAEAMGIDFPNEDGIVPFEDPRLEAVEHACHELAHAILLGIPLFGKQHGSISSKLSDRVGSYINALSQDGAERNEALCFVVERAVLPQLGIQVSDAALFDALWMQVSENEEALDLLRSGEDHEETHEAIRRIPLIYNTYMERVR